MTIPRTAHTAPVVIDAKRRVVAGAYYVTRSAANITTLVGKAARDEGAHARVQHLGRRTGNGKRRMEVRARAGNAVISNRWPSRKTSETL
jgi:hypothetical protein